MRIIFNEPAQTYLPIPIGSLIQTDSMLGHELIAGPMVGNQQLVAHKEPGLGTHVELIGSARKRYNFILVILPVSNEHGIESWQRMLQQIGDPWVPLDNCQHGARRAYYGVPSSPTINTMAFVGGLACFTLWAGSRD